MRRIALLLAGTAVLIAGCGPRGPQFSELGFQQRMERLIGLSKDRVVGHLGPPVSEFERKEDGHIIATYKLDWTDSGGGYTVSVPRTEYVYGTSYNRRGKSSGSYSETRTVYVDRSVPSYSVQRSCFIDLDYDERQRVVGYQYQGDGCMAVERKTP
ncbi:hypothetical protein [Inquilinus limosus]|uniref:Lipoprotein n=1 Tax=Inquilinus limosus MP06 TaxID=1398085 RepID=A0A0A0D202_9PROT|nr:hypothetical protein [Inquilinus limosus]KGM31883.1 hypothetical protein P409_24665 [Inquilinus limosus MP06]